MEAHEIVKMLEELVKVPRVSLNGIISGDKMLVTSLMEGEKALYSFDPNKGAMRRLSKEAISAVAIPPYGSKEVYFTRDVTKGREQHVLMRLDVEGGEEERVDMVPMRITSIVHKDRVFFVGSSNENALYVVDNKRAKKVISFPTLFYVSDYRDGIVIGAGKFRGNPKSMELIIVKEDGSYEVFTPKEGSVNENPIFYKDKVLFESDFEGEVRLYLLDLETKSVEKLNLGEEYEKYSPYEHQFVWLGDSGELIVIGKRDGRSEVFVNGKVIEGPQGNYYNAFVYKGKVYATFTNSSTPTSVLELGKDWKFLYKPEVPSWLSDVIKEVKFEKIRSFDGLEIPTFIIVSGRSEVPGPTVYLIHGGPWAEEDDRFDVMAYSIAALGYHVVKPNYRGSTGYGTEFTMKIIGDPCGAELKDIIAVAEKLKDKLASKSCIMGYSYGGYMTLCALTKSKVFECGVAGASVVDWKEMYELSDAIYRSFIDVLFAGRKELFEERSPINLVEQLEAPLCIVHPQNDSRTPLKPVLKLMDKLTDLGKTFEAHIVPETGHALVTLRALLDILLPALLFLDKQRDSKS